MAKARLDAPADAFADAAVGKSRPHVRHGSAPHRQGGILLDWRKRISDHIAYALLVYTGLQIFVTIAALREGSASVLPGLALVVLVGAIIPACRMMERRWTRLSDAEAGDPARAGAFYKDRAMVWAAAIGLPFVVTGGFRLVAMMMA
ncbi:hypothetical protein [Novosphingobium humi]|uniref:Uncharacterized protein n=1 Tax=Novosphingobium humi TaxID=2282397 RepID=A0ABY7TWQ4_9SPHN|nr:hypothetical protein [Novosphingobium humi]WCT77702.1 hypothetical protein PQ457_01605 [Novosphingobium humi]WJS98775.1 hypothetical protein NYQ05_00840 [Novosphingobium humi]